MKTKFYKKLVPLALIVAMASTNVGLTSVAVNAQTPQASYSTSMDEADFDLVGGAAQSTPEPIAAAKVALITPGGDLKTKLLSGSTFKYTYAYGSTSETPDDDQMASVIIQIPISANTAAPEDFTGVTSLFKIAKAENGTDFAAANGSYQLAVRPIAKGSTIGGSAAANGGVEIEIAMDYKLYKAVKANSNKFYVLAKTGAAAYTSIGEFTTDETAGTGNVVIEQAEPVTYEESKTGVAVKYALKKTSVDSVTPEGYDLVSYKAYKLSTGDVVYPGLLDGSTTPTLAAFQASSEGFNVAGSEYAEKVVARLTPDQVASLPYTEKKAATLEEYANLGTGEKISNHDNTELQAAIKKAQKDYIVGLVTDYKAGTGNNAKFNTAKTELLELIAGLEETTATTIKSSAKTTVNALDNSAEVANVTGKTYASDIADKVVAEKKALFIENKNTVMAPDKTVFAETDEFTKVKSTATEFTDLDYINAFVPNDANYLSATSLSDFLGKRGFVKASDGSNLNKFVWANYLYNAAGYKDAIDALHWEESSDTSIKEAMEYASINEFITSINTGGADLDAVLTGTSKTYFEKSSAWTAKKTELTNALLADEFAHQPELDTAKVNWITETVNAKGVTGSGAAFAKFQVTKNDRTSFAAKATGAEAIVGATKANGKFNSMVTIKAVSADYKAATAKTKQKGDVYASADFYVTPVGTTGYTEASLSKTTDGKGVTFAAPSANDTSAAAKTYTLTLDEGKSFKLPFALKDGADKTLAYDVAAGSKGFTVVNGTVKAIAGGGSGDIFVYPAAAGNTWAACEATKKLDETTAIKVHVVTNSAVKSIKASAKTIAMYPGAEQLISFGTTPASFNTYKFVASGLSDKYTLKWVDAAGNEATESDATHTILKIKAPTAAEIKADETKTPEKSSKAAIKLYKGANEVETVKEYNLTVNWTGSGANAKSVKETYKKAVNGVVDINVPVGGVVNLGASVAPVTADQTINYGISKDKAGLYYSSKKANKTTVWANSDLTGGDVTAYNAANGTSLAYVDDLLAVLNADSYVDPADAKITGDVFMGIAEGTYYVKGWTVAKNGSGNELTTNIYKINVYTPGSSVVMNDLRDTPEYDTDDATDAVPSTGVSPKKASEVYTVVGGQLVSKADAETSGNKTIMGGQTITIAEPYTLGTKEEIDWKCNNPAAIRITRVAEGYHYVNTLGTAGTRNDDTIYSTLDLDLLQAGTYTITGTTKYTKQKYSFKVTVGSDTTKKAADMATNATPVAGLYGTDGRMFFKALDIMSATTATMSVKDTENVYYATGALGLAGKLKFESSNKKVLNVAANGTVKAVGAGTAKIKVTFTSTDGKVSFNKTSKDITVTAQKPEITKITVPAGVTKGTDFKIGAAIKNAKLADCAVKWEYKSYAADEGALDTAISAIAFNAPAGMTAISTGNKPNGTAKLTDEGFYLLRLTVGPKTGQTADNTAVAYAKVQVFEKAPNTVNLTNNSADAKKAIASLAAAPKADPDDNTKTIGGAGYGVYIIPVFADTKDGELASAGDIEWTSSNVSLATAETVAPIPQSKTAWKDVDFKTYLDSEANVITGLAGIEEENAIIKAANNAYGVVKIVTAAKDSGLTGKVTLTGILKNSGKKVTVTLNLKNEDKSVTDKYSPLSVNSGSPLAAPAFQNVAALKGSAFDQDEVDKLAKGKAYTYYEYVLVDTDSAADLKAKPADHIKVRNGATQDKIVYTVDDEGKPTFTNITAAGTATVGTYYLAQVAVTKKVKTAATYVEGTDTVDDNAILEDNPTKQIITIASSTPLIVKATS